MGSSTARGRRETTAQPPDGEDDGILRLGEEPGEEPRHGPLFRVGGKAYEGLLNPDGKLLLRYVHVLRKRGGNEAASWLLEQMLRPDAYAVLHDDPKVTDADVRKIVDKCQGLLFGARPAPKARG